MTCKIYTVLSDTVRKYYSCGIQKHYEMNNWLLERGKKEFTYEYPKE